MAFPLADPVLLDDFNRADSTTLGGNWIKGVFGAGHWDTHMAIDTNAIDNSAGGDGAEGAAYNTGVSGMKLAMSMKLTTATADDTESYGFIVRRTVADDGWAVTVDASSSPDVLNLYRFTGGTPTNIHTRSLDCTFGNGDFVACTAEDYGSSVTAFTVWRRTSAGSWVQIAAFVDTAGFAGPFYGGFQIGDNTPILDDFSIEADVRWEVPWCFGAGAQAQTQTDAAAIAPELPAGWRGNDIVYVPVMTNGNNIPTISVGWTEEAALAQNNAAISSKAWWRRMVSGDSAPTVTDGGSTALSSSNGMFARCYGFRDCISTGTPHEDPTAVGNTSTETTPDTAAIDTLGPNRHVVNFCLIDDDTSNVTNHTPSGWGGAVVDTTSTIGADNRQCLIDQLKASAGAVSAAVVCTLSAGETWRSLTLALIPTASLPLYQPTRPTIYRL